MKTRTSKKANTTDARLKAWQAATGGRQVMTMTDDFTGWIYTLEAGGRTTTGQATGSGADAMDAAAEIALAAWN